MCGEREREREREREKGRERRGRRCNSKETTRHDSTTVGRDLIKQFGLILNRVHAYTSSFSTIKTKGRQLL